MVVCPYHEESSWWKVKGAGGLEGVESLRLLMKPQINQLKTIYMMIIYDEL